MKILFIGDVFGEPAIAMLEKHLKKIIIKNKIDFVIVQGENVSGRKGLVPSDYNRLKACGVNAFTMGNHIWAKPQIRKIINNPDIIRPYNVKHSYPGKGYQVFTVKGQTIKVLTLMGIAFNNLYTGWKEPNASCFFDAFDKFEKESPKTDFTFVDFHGETTSEKNVFGLYVDGKINGMVGTHTHIQTNDAKVLPKGTAFITDAGMTGPINCAIGASYDTVYRKMRFNERVRFGVSTNPIQMQGAILSFNKNGNEIDAFKKDLR